MYPIHKSTAKSTALHLVEFPKRFIISVGQGPGKWRKPV